MKVTNPALDEGPFSGKEGSCKMPATGCGVLYAKVAVKFIGVFGTDLRFLWFARHCQ
jgi:hypothetical protein